MTSLRLDLATRASLDRLAQRPGQTRSEVLRDATAPLTSDEREEAPSAYERLRPFVGVADSGGRQLSQQSGRRFQKALAQQRRARRARRPRSTELARGGRPARGKEFHA